ncbi:MAG: hypothetical protein RLZZ165_2235 [Bacteroidota bacterium]|jgi:dihydropyrimidine dehydrogenase (NAD+) subunit PreA
MADLSIDFAGIKAPNPFWLASGPPTNSGYQVMKAFDAGWGGAVWKTLGVPVVNVSSRYGAVNYRNHRMVGFNNIELISDRTLADNLREIEQVRKHFPHHPVIASLMVESRDEWHQIVRDVTNAGASGIELNFGCPHGMCERGMGSAVGQDPEVLQVIVGWVMEVARIPVVTKLTPNISHITDPAIAAVEGGTNAISLINTVKSIVGVNLDTLTAYPEVDGLSTNGGYCGPAVKPIALNMLKECAQHPDIHVPLSGIGGIENWKDAAEFILLGAGSLQVCTAVMHYGFGIIRELLPGLERYMDGKGFRSISEMCGRALPRQVEWKKLNLKHKVVAEIDQGKCIGCQLCYIACDDGAHQAIALPTDGSRVPRIIEENCVGCNLCSLVCPVEQCITMEKRDDGKESLTWEQRTAAGDIPDSFNDPRAGGNAHRVPTVEDAIRMRRRPSSQSNTIGS